jgi:hypothetical protein
VWQTSHFIPYACANGGIAEAAVEVTSTIAAARMSLARSPLIYASLNAPVVPTH